MLLKYIKIFMIILYIVIFCYISYSDSLNSPLEFEEKKKKTVKNQKVDLGIDFIKYPFINIIKFYQNYINPIKGQNCRMYPSCSEYGMIVISKYNLTGVLMTMDRLLRCGHDLYLYERIVVGDSIKYLDLPQKAGPDNSEGK